MSEAKRYYHKDRTLYDRHGFGAIGGNLSLASLHGTLEESDNIVAALNDSESLREQVRLYELAAERGWITRRPYPECPYINCLQINFSPNLHYRVLAEGSTPTAAIAAAEKKAGYVG